MRHACLPLLALLLWSLAATAVAGTGYKCVDARGHVSFQDTPCPRGSRQSVLHLTHASAATLVPAATVSSPAWPSPSVTPPPPVAPIAPPPVLYRCTRATGGTYLSSNGRTRPYLAPMGMLPMSRVPLAGTPGLTPVAGAATPTPGMIGSHYVEVRDTCRPLPPDAACAVLEKRNDANDQAIHDAFPDQLPRLLKKRKHLHAELTGCR
ncbi:MAG TPA: DUF4124 domain-containing protein [Rhodanobacteraceae bacterium]